MNPRLSALELSQPRKLPPVFQAALVQLLAFAASSLIIFLLRTLGVEAGLLSFLITQSALAVAISSYLGMPIWWLVIQAGFVPALLAVSGLSIAPGWFLLGFVLLALIYGQTFKTQVPLYLSRRQVWNAIRQQLPDTPGLRLLDLGSGLGGLVRHLADMRQDSHASGIESAPLPCLISKLRMAGRRNANIEWGDFWQADLSAYDVVCAYLSPVPMPALWEKVQREMRPGTLFISYRFAIPGVQPTRIVKLQDLGQTELYLWRV